MPPRSAPGRPRRRRKSPDLDPVAGQQPLTAGPAPRPSPDRATSGGTRPPAAAMAAALLAQVGEAGAEDLLFVAAGERRADEIARALGALSRGSGISVSVFPPWDCLPYDRASPSRESMGRRMAVLAVLAEGADGPRVVISSPEALVQRIPPLKSALPVWRSQQGDSLDRDALRRFAVQAGYQLTDRVDEPGEIAFLGEVVDVYPPTVPAPLRLVLTHDELVAEIRTFDPVTQRSAAAVSSVELRPVSECRPATAAAQTQVPSDGSPQPEIDLHRLPELLDGQMSTLTSHLNGRWLMEPEAPQRMDRALGQITDAFETRRNLGGAEAPPLAPDALYISPAEAKRILDQTGTLASADFGPTPSFFGGRSPAGAAAAWVAQQLDAGQRVVLSGLPHERRPLLRALKRRGLSPRDDVETWPMAARLPAGTLACFDADLEGGFMDADQGVIVLAMTDVFGARLAHAGQSLDSALGGATVRPGDLLIHEDHGLGILRGLEQIDSPDGPQDVLRLEYRDGAILMVPVREFARLWRYGAETASVALDRLKGDGWSQRRARASQEIDTLAEGLVQRANAAKRLRAPRLQPDRSDYLRFSDGFPYPESPDQTLAIEAALADLASGRPMNRLVCGDVGFGKTEVALRAAAAAALAGRQVLVAAPTTVLARQHHQIFAERFRPFGVDVACLLGTTPASEAARIRTGLAEGSIAIVIGGPGLAADSLVLKRPGLSVIDEEHRFGSDAKAALAAKAPHLLALSATPIPRTLQAALVGLQTVSVLASPPARRRPVRTFTTEFDKATLRLTLLREQARGGQSFIVAPRIEDLEGLGRLIAELAPDLNVVTAHGDLAAETLDRAVAGFAAGEGHVLLATNIIENGLDVPRANTMLIWRPDLFGLAQLHQLRGRVGRGRRQGFTYLICDPEHPLSDAARGRLQALEAADRLGAGFAVSAQDLDQRGAGDLLGDDQAGHVHLIGADLYQHRLAAAVRLARGEPVPIAPAEAEGAGRLPETYLPDPDTRIDIYARLYRAAEASVIEALQDEVEDRFGPLPQEVSTLLHDRRLAILAAGAGVLAVVQGPKAVALSFEAARARQLREAGAAPEGCWSDDRLLLPPEVASSEQLEMVFEALAAA